HAAENCRCRDSKPEQRGAQADCLNHHSSPCSARGSDWLRLKSHYYAAGIQRHGRRSSMAYGAWRGMVGTVKPTKGSGSLEELIRMLRDAIGVIPLFNKIKHGTIAESRDVIPAYEEKVAELAADKVDLIHPAGTPPFMLLGYRKEQELIAAWEKKYGI